MRIFISWSGELSRQLGEVVRNWLPSALQHVKPYFTPDDIDKGAKWASEISKELSASSVCIIILNRARRCSLSIDAWALEEQRLKISRTRNRVVVTASEQLGNFQKAGLLSWTIFPIA
jgi:hypothetical protein